MTVYFYSLNKRLIEQYINRARRLEYPHKTLRFFYPNDFGFATTFELQNGSFYKMYQYIDLDQAGYSNYIIMILLENSFKITMQNSNNFALLNLKKKIAQQAK